MEKTVDGSERHFRDGISGSLLVGTEMSGEGEWRRH